MPTWGELLKELNNQTPSSATGGQQKNQPPDLDSFRRKYMVKLQQHTGRNTIAYISRFNQPAPNATPDMTSIVDGDLQGFMEVVHGLQGDNLDLILHLPGGTAEAAESILKYLRTKFSNIRVIIPHMAMSAATMISCGADSIVMGKHSFIGPVDPQLILRTNLGTRSIAAQKILDQFERAKKECSNPDNLAAWMPMLSQYGPDLLVLCEDATTMSREIVKGWLKDYMLKGQNKAGHKASNISKWLSSHKQFMSHSRHIDREQARSKGLIVEDMENDQIFQDLVLSVFHTATLTFNHTGCQKIIENHLGKGYFKTINVILSQQPIPVPVIPSAPTPPTPQ